MNHRSVTVTQSEFRSTESDQPLTPTGRLFVHPTMDQVINASLAVQFPLDVAAIKDEFRESPMLRHPRFCSLLVRDTGGREHWRRTQVDIDRHVISHETSVAADPSVSDEDAVNDFIAGLTVSSPLPADKPLWEIHLLLAHRTAVFRLHHALGDGISLMSMLLSSCRRSDDPSKPPTVGRASSPGRRWSAWALVMAFWYTLVYVVEFLSRAMWLRDRTTAISGGTGVELWPRKLATARFQLEDMKVVKRAVAEATINDVLFGVISCGLSRYLDMTSSKALPQEGLQMTGVAMVNLRPHTGLQEISKPQWGNRFGMLLLPAYYHSNSNSNSSSSDSNPIQFVKRAKAMLDKKKLSMEGPFSYALGHMIMSFFGPKIAATLNYRILCNTTFTLSNVIGPQEEMMIAGNPIKYLRATSSSLPQAITMHMVSYSGNADLQIQVVREIIPDPKLLAKYFEDALLEMKEAAPPTS